MGKTSIEWTDFSFNHVIGCTKVAEGCAHCYAEAFSKRTGKAKWGTNGSRVKTSESYWKQPLKWNREAEAASERRRVFCASMADVFEDWHGPVLGHKGAPLVINQAGVTFHVREDWTPCYGERGVTLDEIRGELFRLIDATPHLDWLLLTKRPENIRRMWHGYGYWRCDECGEARDREKGEPEDYRTGHECSECDNGLLGTLLPLGASRGPKGNVWLGTSIATQADADRNIPLLLECRDLSPVLFLSIEPLVEAVNLNLGIDHWVCSSCNFIGSHKDEFAFGRCGSCGHELDESQDHGIDWVICGGESGYSARPCHPDWVRSIREQCRRASVPFFFKQWGEWREADIKTPQEFMEMEKKTWTWLDRNGESGFTFGTEDRACMVRVGKKAAGRLLDGVEHSEFPAAVTK